MPTYAPNPDADDFRRPGLYYVHRDGLTVSQLDGTFMPDIERPERDIVQALAAYVADQLKAPEQHGRAT